MSNGFNEAAAAEAVVDHYYPFWTSLVFQNRTLFDFSSSPYAVDSESTPAHLPRGLIPIDPPVGGKDRKFLILTSSHTASEFTEYDVLPAEGTDAWTQATPAIISVWAPILVTGFAVDDAFGPEDLVGVIARNGEHAAGAIADKIVNTLLGSGTAGLLRWVDETTTVAGVNRTTYAAFGSAETAVNGALTLNDMDDLVEEVCSGDRNAPEEGLEWWVGRNQVTNYRRLAGITGNAHTPESVSPGGTLDLGYTGYAHNGIPIRSIPDFSTTDWVLVHRPSIRIQEIRSLQVRMKDYAGDGDRMILSWRGAPRIDHPQWCGKLTGVTA